MNTCEHERMPDGQELYGRIDAQLSLSRAVAHIERMNEWYRYTGTPEGEAFVDDLAGRLEQYGIPYRTETYQAYASLPVSSTLTLDGGEVIPSIADVYSAQAPRLRGQIVYDRWSESRHHTPEELVERHAAFKDRIVLTRDGGGNFVNEVARAGGLAVLHINTSRGGYIHHSNVSPFWGTPGIREVDMLCVLPSAGISLEDGERLIGMLENREITAALDVKMDTRIVTTRMPIVDIPGRSDKFVLIHGHYDSWYEGITDNAASDAILLELARAFYMNRDSLKRGIRIAWWSGHSDARYAGSTWYCDRHWDELNRRCVASINLDLCGCKCANQIRVRTTCMEGESFTADLIREFTGAEPKPYIPMVRGADQSFWGVHVPIHIMFKYEPTDETRVSPCPSGGPWWHTAQDTIDKLDRDILMRDMRINAKAACLIANSDALPVELTWFAQDMERRLMKISEEAPAGCDMTGVFASVGSVKSACAQLESYVDEHEDTDFDAVMKAVAGELVRLVYTQGSMYQQDLSLAYQPLGVLSQTAQLARDMHGAPMGLCAETDFVRACNRIQGQCDVLSGTIERILKGESI